MSSAGSSSSIFLKVEGSFSAFSAGASAFSGSAAVSSETSSASKKPSVLVASLIASSEIERQMREAAERKKVTIQKKEKPKYKVDFSVLDGLEDEE